MTCLQALLCTHCSPAYLPDYRCSDYLPHLVVYFEHLLCLPFPYSPTFPSDIVCLPLLPVPFPFPFPDLSKEGKEDSGGGQGQGRMGRQRLRDLAFMACITLFFVTFFFACIPS